MTPGPDPSERDSVAEVELDALTRWRDAGGRRGDLPDGLKDSDLKQILDSGRKDEREVSRRLSNKFRPWASEIVELLISVSGRGTTPPVPPAADPRPPVQQAPVSSRPPPQGAASLVGEVSRFVPTKRIGPAALVTLRVIELAEGIRLRWSADPEGVEESTAYRVVSLDGHPPHSPESGDLVDVTTELSCVDLRAPGSALRFYQVYRYGGPTQEEDRKSVV